MLTCIACSKQLGGSIHEQEDEDSFQTPRTKQTVKTFTDQIKDMAVKASGAYKHCKPCSGSMSQRSAYAEESGSERFLCSYRRTESSSSGSLGKETETKSKSLSRDDAPLSMGGKVEPPFFMEEEEPKEWIAQVEPGILITFISLPEGGNSLKRIRFSRELFEKLQAQRWWAENYDRIMELYNVQKFNHHSCPLTNLPKPEHENASTQDCSNTPALAIDNHAPNHNSNPRLSSISGAKTERSSLDASIRASSSGEADQSQEHSASVSNASDLETEWVEQDEPGVYITIRALSDGTRELRRVRFSREKFGEIHARIWWEENRTRIQEQYL